jgi:hypothetical protein
MSQAVVLNPLVSESQSLSNSDWMSGPRLTALTSSLNGSLINPYLVNSFRRTSLTSPTSTSTSFAR